MPDVERVEKIADQIEQIGSASAVIGVPGCRSSADLSSFIDAARAAQLVSGVSAKIVILHPDGLAGNTNGEEQLSKDSNLVPLPVPLPHAELTPNGVSADFILSVASASRTLDARACCLWSSAAESATPAAIHWFLQTIDEGKFDLAVPRYKPLKFGSLINSSIIYPLTRTLYGLRIPYPIAVDLCISPRLTDDMLQPDPKTGIPRPPRWITTHAVCRGLRVCEVEVGLPPPSLPDALDVSSVLAMVLDSLFLDIEQNAVFWQRTRGSQALPTFGQQTPTVEERGAVEVQSMIDGFNLAFRNLGEIWGFVLPPATLVELKKLTRMSSGNFRLADPTWVRIVYDFVIAHRQRVMNRDHLLRALTPIYLAWVASYALEIGNATAAQAGNRREQLALVYENEKPYLLSRWRWPDRFNP